jgi:hypothetical protein
MISHSMIDAAQHVYYRKKNENILTVTDDHVKQRYLAVFA